jgi:hypothetical protein
MKHLSEEELILYHYGEVEDLAPFRAHLAECPACATQHDELRRVLELAGRAPVPERDDNYGVAVWERLAGRLPPRRRFWPPLLFRPRTWALAGAMAGLVVAAFFIGRVSTRRPAPPTPAAEQQYAGERVLLVAVGDHLERSQIVLLELANARPEAATDITMEQEFAADLVDANRLYRQTAAHSGDAAITGVLDELERVLLEIAHSPSRLSPGELKKIQGRIESQGILFKIRIIGSEVRDAEAKSAAGPARETL